MGYCSVYCSVRHDMLHRVAKPSGPLGLPPIRTVEGSVRGVTRAKFETRLGLTLRFLFSFFFSLSLYNTHQDPASGVMWCL